MSDKPPAVWPPWHAAIVWRRAMEVARTLGYCLALHGSLGRDLDVVAIPWVDDAKPAEDLVEAITEAAAGLVAGPDEHNPQTGTVKPHGRLCWAVHLGAGTYMDLSVMPRSCPIASRV